MDRDQLQSTFDRQAPTYDQQWAKLSALRDCLHLLLDSAFFRAIAECLRPGGLLASSDLASDLTSAAQQSILEVWFRTMATADLSPEALQRMRDAYARDVAVRPAHEVERIIESGGFESPVQFFQAGLIHAWYSKRSDTLIDA